MGAAGQSYEGTFAVEATDPEVVFLMDVDTSVRLREGRAGGDVPVLRGRSVELVEALSSRLALPESAPAEWRRLHNGLRETWDLELDPQAT